MYFIQAPREQVSSRPFAQIEGGLDCNVEFKSYLHSCHASDRSLRSLDSEGTPWPSRLAKALCGFQTARCDAKHHACIRADRPWPRAD